MNDLDLREAMIRIIAFGNNGLSNNALGITIFAIIEFGINSRGKSKKQNPL